VLSSIDYHRSLDVACGPGTFMGTLPETKAAAGIDISEKQILYAQSRYMHANRSFICADGQRFPFKDACFQLITVLEFIEHLPQDTVEQLFSEALRCLVPGGIILITTPDYRSFWPVLEWILFGFSKIDYRKQHICRFTPEKFRLLLARMGFKIVLIRKYLFVSPFFAAISWQLADTIFKSEFNKLKNKGCLLLALAQKP
jgi:SAM-dependent methyltransferase